MAVRRGDFVLVALKGDYGKPRPALVIQSDLFAEHPSLTILPITSTLVEAALLRLPIEPAPLNGLRLASQIMIDKSQTVARDKIGGVIGHADDATMLAVSRSLALFLGIV